MNNIAMKWLKVNPPSGYLRSPRIHRAGPMGLSRANGIKQTLQSAEEMSLKDIFFIFSSVSSLILIRVSLLMQKVAKSKIMNWGVIGSPG